MSNGEIGSQENTVRGMALDGITIKAMLASELSAVQSAQGDVKGAEVRMVEQVQASRREFEAAQGRLADREEDLAAGAEELEIVGRPIHIDEGVSAGEVRAVSGKKGEKEYVLPRQKRLKGVNGVIRATHIGQAMVRGARPNAIFLEVGVKGSLIPPRAFRRYLVDIDEAVFTTGEVPEPNDR